MRVLVIGASGAIGRHLVPQLLAAGHAVVATGYRPTRLEPLRGLGAQTMVLDALDADAVHRAVAGLRPDAIVYEATALWGLQGANHLDRTFAGTNRLRTEGVNNVIAAARAARVPRLVAQSYACHRYLREGGPVKTEDDPLDADPPREMEETMTALRHLDHAVIGAGGTALRLGCLYGDPDDALAAAVRGRRLFVVGDGSGIWSHVHLEDAAAATVLALDHDGPAIYNIVDDEPAPLADWLPELARVLGTPLPPHLPVLVARIFAGEVPVVLATESRGASNEKAKRELGWTLRHPSWRDGFAAAHGGLVGAVGHGGADAIW